MKIKQEIHKSKIVLDSFKKEDSQLKDEYFRQKKLTGKVKKETATLIFTNRNIIGHQIDSLQKTIIKLRQSYANELLISERSQKIVKLRKDAMSSGGGKLASKIGAEFRTELLHEANKKWLSKTIDRTTFIEEIKTIDAIEAALDDIVFAPKVRNNESPLTNKLNNQNTSLFSSGLRYVLRLKLPLYSKKREPDPFGTGSSQYKTNNE